MYKLSIAKAINAKLRNSPCEMQELRNIYKAKASINEETNKLIHTKAM